MRLHKALASSLLAQLAGCTIRARAPLRLGLAGGGTDLSPYCDRHGGAVLNSTIQHYAYADIDLSPDRRLHLVAEDIGVTEALDCDPDALPDAALAIHAGVYRRMTRQFLNGELIPLQITTSVDVPPGSGLGSSSALAVALVEAFRALLSLPLGLYDVAHLAFEIERQELNLSGGKQDQYAAAFGGTNFIEFLDRDRVIVNPLRVDRGFLNELETSLVTCFSGVSRRSDSIIAEQQRGVADGPALEAMHQLKLDAIDMKQALLRGEVRRMADILNRSWSAKKRTAAGISTDRIEHLSGVAMSHGATAAKVSGAGGGGFLMFLVPPRSRPELVRALNRAGGVAGPVHLTGAGAESWVRMN